MCFVSTNLEQNQQRNASLCHQIKYSKEWKGLEWGSPWDLNGQTLFKKLPVNTAKSSLCSHVWNAAGCTGKQVEPLEFDAMWISSGALDLGCWDLSVGHSGVWPHLLTQHCWSPGEEEEECRSPCPSPVPCLHPVQADTTGLRSDAKPPWSQALPRTQVLGGKQHFCRHSSLWDPSKPCWQGHCGSQPSPCPTAGLAVPFI